MPNWKASWVKERTDRQEAITSLSICLQMTHLEHRGHAQRWKGLKPAACILPGEANCRAACCRFARSCDAATCGTSNKCLLVNARVHVHVFLHRKVANNSWFCLFKPAYGKFASLFPELPSLLKHMHWLECRCLERTKRFAVACTSRSRAC